MKPSHSTISWGAVIFLVLACSFLAYQRVHKPRLLILHSYHAKMPWVKGLNQGVEKVFAQKAYIDLRYFYMNTKHKHGRRYLAHIQQSIQHTIERWKPDVVIAFDYDAQSVAANLLSKGLDTRIIFAGITNEERLNDFHKSPFITGITEKIPVLAMREILSLIFRDKRRLYYLSDDSSAARMLDKEIRSENWGSYQLVAHKRVRTEAQWKAAVLEAQEKADILLVSMYQMLRKDKKRVNRKHLVRWMHRHSKIPIVGMYESFIVDGGFMAIAISSLEQGFTAAHMAYQVLERKSSIHELPVLKGNTFSLYIDEHALKKRFPDMHIPVILDAFARSRSSLKPPEPQNNTGSTVESNEKRL